MLFLRFTQVSSFCLSGCYLLCLPYSLFSSNLGFCITTEEHKKELLLSSTAWQKHQKRTTRSTGPPEPIPHVSVAGKGTALKSLLAPDSKQGRPCANVDPSKVWHLEGRLPSSLPVQTPLAATASPPAERHVLFADDDEGSWSSNLEEEEEDGDG